MTDFQLDTQRRVESLAAKADCLGHAHRLALDGAVAHKLRETRLQPGNLEGAVAEVAQLAFCGRLELARCDGGLKEADQARPALVIVVVEAVRKTRLLGHHHLVDRRGSAALGRRSSERTGGQFCLVGAQRVVIRLGTPAEHCGQRVPRGADVPAANARTLGRLDCKHLAWLGQMELVESVHVKVEALRGPQGAAGQIGSIFGCNQVLVRGQTHVRDVDPAEEAVPVAVVGLATVQVVNRSIARGSRGHGRHLR